jgi:hypothetical protein
MTFALMCHRDGGKPTRDRARLQTTGEISDVEHDDGR